MKWWIPVLCATLALSTEPQGESASLGSSKREEDRLIVRDAKYIARRELAATQRAIEGELRRVKMYRFEDQGLVKASEARQDRVPALAAR